MSENPQKPKVRKMTDDEKAADAERRLEIQYLRHLKRKYPQEDKRMSQENQSTY